MGAAGSVMDPSALRKEYETKSTESLSDEELLMHMKSLIISAPSSGSPAIDDTAAPKTEAGAGVVVRRSVTRRNSHDAGVSQSNSKTDLSIRRGSAVRRGSGLTGNSSDRPGSAPRENTEAPKTRPRSSHGERQGGKPSKARRMSYLGDTVKVASENKPEDEMTPEREAALSAAAVIAGESSSTAMVDSWESVSQQPSCPVCRMAFSSIAKRDQHIKYSPAHAKTVQDAQNQAIEKLHDLDKQRNSRTIYSGTKLFWRTGLHVELFMQQHEQADAVQVLAFDTGTDRELGCIWVSMEQVVARLDKNQLEHEMLLAAKDFQDLGLETKPEDVLAEAIRKAAVSFIVKRLQVEENTITNTGASPEALAQKSYKIDVHKMASDEVGESSFDLVVEQPSGVNPAFSRAAMKRASIQQIEEAMSNLRQSISAVKETSKEAVRNLENAEGTVEQGRRGSVEIARRDSLSMPPATVVS